MAKSLTKCPHCSAMVREDRLNRHIRKCHPAALAAGTVPLPRRVSCPRCGQRVRLDHLGRHIAIVHEQVETRDRRNDRRVEWVSLDALADTYDSLDAGKYLGYMRRENGRFGSLPLYDGYDDEDFP